MSNNAGSSRQSTSKVTENSTPKKRGRPRKTPPAAITSAASAPLNRQRTVPSGLDHTAQSSPGPVNDTSGSPPPKRQRTTRSATPATSPLGNSVMTKALFNASAATNALAAASLKQMKYQSIMQKQQTDAILRMEKHLLSHLGVP